MPNLLSDAPRVKEKAREKSPAPSLSVLARLGLAALARLERLAQDVAERRPRVG